MSSNEWQAVVSGNAELRLTQEETGRVPALRLDFDFKQGGGFVVARRALKRDMPEEYAVRAANLGMDFETPQHDGKLNIIYLRPLDLSVDERPVHRIKELQIEQSCKPTDNEKCVNRCLGALQDVQQEWHAEAVAEQ